MPTPQAYLGGPSVGSGGSVGPADESGSFPNGPHLHPAVTMQEAIGSAMALKSVGGHVHLLGQDAFSTDTDIGYVDFALIANGLHTGTIRSYERWVRVQFTPPFNTVRSFRFWVTNLGTVPSGWTVRWGTSSTYHTPVNSGSSIAVNTVPITDPGSANCGGTNRLVGTGTQYSDWIVLQAKADLTIVTSPGPILGYQASGAAIQLDYKFAWIET